MEWNNYHRSFKLNNQSFKSVNELLNYSERLDKTLHNFLLSWFNNQSSISVKTSGSTGKPKEILLQKKHVINSAKATGNFFELHKHTSALLCLPITYIAGKLMVIRALVLGWHLDMIKPSISPLEDVFKTYHFTAFTPMQLENSLHKLHLLDTVIVGGGAVSNVLSEKLVGLKTKVFATYGMTETITHIALKRLNNFTETPTFYKTLPEVNIYVDKRSCLVIKAPKIADDIIFTNDVVQLISSNTFNYLGRFDNVINSGGIKLQPEIIEEKLSKILTSRFFVAGLPDDYLGEKLVLVVEGSSQNIELENINLSKYEKPKSIYFVNKFVETSSGKVQRKETLQKLQTN